MGSKLTNLYTYLEGATVQKIRDADSATINVNYGEDSVSRFVSHHGKT